jgi:hypothetical protein
MDPILPAGLAIGGLSAAWMFVMGLTGWYKDPATINLFLVAVPIQVAGLVWGLRRTAAEGRNFAQQVAAGTLMSIVAGTVVFGASLVFTTLAFPEYFRELQHTYRTILERQGRSQAEIDAALAAATAGATPLGQAMQGFVGTMLTGIAASALIAIVVRRRAPLFPGPPPDSPAGGPSRG